jgi:hypothetical protein
MKRSECNYIQKRVWDLVVEEMNCYVGGLENTCMDYEKQEKEYKEAIKDIMDYEGCVAYVRSQVFGSWLWREVSETHFVTREWTETRIRNFVRKGLRSKREYLGLDTSDLD